MRNSTFIALFGTAMVALLLLWPAVTLNELLTTPEEREIEGTIAAKWRSDTGLGGTRFHFVLGDSDGFRSVQVSDVDYFTREVGDLYVFREDNPGFAFNVVFVLLAAGISAIAAWIVLTVFQITRRSERREERFKLRAEEAR